MTKRDFLSLMPWPARLDRRTGAYALPERIGVVARSNDPLLKRVVDLFTARLRILTGIDAATESSTAVEFDVQQMSHEEAYTLSVRSVGIAIRGGTAVGAARGAETLLQLIRREDSRWVVPFVEIEDAPRYSWRGVLIDPARHFLPVAVVKRFISSMAAMKLNVLHWHLSDDQGFRMESRRFPRLHERGSQGHFYRQDEAREVIAFASDHGIRVVPEFDVPGHTTSWLAGYPFLGSLPGDETAGENGRYELRRGWGVSDFALDPTREEIYRFLEEFISEMCPIFPDPCFHIGGDEVLPVAWTSNPRIVRWMADHGMQHTRDLQVYFNRRVTEILARCGKRMVGWDEILHDDLPAEALIQSWRGQAFFAEALQRHEAILSSGYYLDQLLPASYHYTVDPEDNAALTEEQKERIAGGEGCLWGEYIGRENLDVRAWPRLCAVAERLWSPPDRRDIGDMYERLEFASEHMEKLGSRHRLDHRVLLERLAGDTNAIGALETLAAVVEPVKFYDRALARLDNIHTPLNRLVDAVKPESDTARIFTEVVEQFRLRRTGGEKLRELLGLWRDHRNVLADTIRYAPFLAEVDELSRNVARAARAGLEAIDYVERNETPSDRWWLSSVSLIERAKVPRAELVIAVLPAIRQLVDLAAARG